MKKVLLLILSLATFSFAGINEDVNESIQYINQKNYVKALDKLRTIRFDKEEGELFERVNFSIFQLSGDLNEQINALQKIVKNKDSKGEYAILANELLADYEKDINKKLALQKELNKRTDNKNIAYLLNEVLSLYKLNKEKEANKINDIIDKNENLDIKKAYYINLVAALYQEKLDNYASKISNRALKLDKKDSVYLANVYLVVANYQKNNKSAEKYLESALKLDKSDNMQVRVADTYAKNGEYKKAISMFENLYKKTKEFKYAGAVLLYSTLDKDSKKENAYYDILLKSGIKNTDIAIFLVNYNNEKLLDSAIKYAKKAVSQNEENSKQLLEQITNLKK
ncbi:tetratricopeptide repeat protein [Oceanivirga miroungae]|uniref:Tetratricopeptide repeat protein n=1 Tax=Oceanivirga miroungae TaxID=1130046 RepID=A0A6I8MDB5_9FUSO|nr:hypothetical protein [Oceanivirga miroungae]VWL85090.1 hypothetical protein OMES3154_00372 [Oceanivirga miroungae]